MNKDATAPQSPFRERGCDQAPLLQADQLIAAHIQSGEVSAAALLVRRGDFEFARAYGKAGIQTPFLLGSPSKPMTVSAAMILRDRGQLALSDPVCRYLPQFKGDGRDKVTIKHLVTHTSGLPDMLPENAELRKKHAPVGEFVDSTCGTPLLFEPGTKVSYQSMGILLAGTIVEKITGMPLAAFMKENIFQPLQMAGTSLGLGGRSIGDTAQSQVAEPSDWDWNSIYWRNFGESWGGILSTAHDLATFVEQFAKTDSTPWLPETRQEMRTLQTPGLSESWGLGWLVQPSAFAQSSSPAAYGHYGTPGTVVWHDPQCNLTCVLLTTRPATHPRDHLLGPVSDLAAESARRHV